MPILGKLAIVNAKLVERPLSKKCSIKEVYDESEAALNPKTTMYPLGSVRTLQHLINMYRHGNFG